MFLGNDANISINAEYISVAVPSKKRPQPAINKVSPVKTDNLLSIGDSTK